MVFGSMVDRHQRLSLLDHSSMSFVFFGSALQSASQNLYIREAEVVTLDEAFEVLAKYLLAVRRVKMLSRSGELTLQLHLVCCRLD